jgi:cysteine sulfinate desulfinase/cysteine desulfurase-like protein
VCALRLSLGRTSTEADVDAALAALSDAVPAARAVHAAGVEARG